MTWGLPQRMRSHCWQKRPKLNFFAHLWPISDFFYNSPNSTNTFFSNQTQDTFICGRKSDTYLMFFKVTAVWTVMSSHPNFTSLRWDRRYNSASEEAGSGKIRCKQWMKPAWLTPLMELISWEKVRFWTQLDSFPHNFVGCDCTTTSKLIHTRWHVMSRPFTLESYNGNNHTTNPNWALRPAVWTQPKSLRWGADPDLA